MTPIHVQEPTTKAIVEPIRRSQINEATEVHEVFVESLRVEPGLYADSYADCGKNAQQ